MTRRVLAAVALLCALASPALSACLVVGDSIAVGMGAVLGGCRTSARVGAASAEIVGKVVPGLPIYLNSVGTNDNPGGAGALLANLVRIRAREAGAQRIIWFVPRFEPARSIVLRFAAANGDPTVTATAWSPPATGFHPASYGPPARAALAFMHPLPPARPGAVR